MESKPNRTDRRASMRAPTPVILRLRQDLEPNEYHPLSGIDPEQRNSDRQQLIASILARLANGQSRNYSQLDTMLKATSAESKSRERTTEAR